MAEIKYTEEHEWLKPEDDNIVTVVDVETRRVLAEIPVATILVDSGDRIVLYDGQAAKLLSRRAPPRLGQQRIAQAGPVCARQTHGFGPPGMTGRSRKPPMDSTRSYMTSAPARLTLIQNRVGIFTTWSQRASISGDRSPRSRPRT